jgi:DNA-binding transcriptional MerR regulator
MANTADGTYRVAAFAKLTGVSVRALRHYDHLGLLKPRRSDGGYRVYTLKDLEVLEQIVSLKFIGVPLRKISVLRDASPDVLATALTAQWRTLEAKQRLLRHAMDALIDAAMSLRTGGDATTLYKNVIEVMHRHDAEQEWLANYHALVERKMAHLRSVPKSKRDELFQQWRELVAEIEASLDEDPSSPKAQALADRHIALTTEVTGVLGDTLLGLFSSSEFREQSERYMSTLPESLRERIKATALSVPREAFQFIRRAMAARRRTA